MLTTQRKVIRSFGKLTLLALLLFPLKGNAQDNIIGPFSGLNNTDNSATIPQDKAQDLLNVDLSLGGKSVIKRKGFSVAYALTVTSSPIHGIYDFYDTSGNDIALAFNDSYLTSSINGGSPTALLTNNPNGATFQCIDSQGFAYCVNTTRNNIIKTNGATTSTIIPLSTGTMITVTPDRLVTAGFLEAPNRVDFSAAADFTSWATGVAPTSAFAFTITAPGSKITHITYAFNRIFWFKNNSFGYILQGQTAADWVVQTVSPNIGTLDNSSVFDKGILYFRAQDAHIYSYDGSNLVKLTRDIGATIGASQNRTSNSWTQTTQSDFATGASTPTLWVSTTVVPNSLVLDTATAISSFVDTSASDFGAGALVNLDSTTSSGNLRLSLLSYSLSSLFIDPSSGCGNICTAPYYASYRVLSTKTGYLSSISLNLKKTGSPANFGVNFTSDSGGLPGSVFESAVITAASIGTSTAIYNVSFGSTTILVSGTTYWIQVGPNGTCDASNKIEWNGQGGVGGSPGPVACGTGLTSNAFPRLNYELFQASYTNSGSILSRSFDTTFTTNTWVWNWSNLNVSTTIPSSTSITYETQTSSSSVGAYDGLVSVGAGAAPSSIVKEFIKYKASFSTTNSTTTPILSDLTIAMSNRIRPGATYYSAVKNAPALTSWDTFQVNKQDNGGTQSFSIRSSTNIIQVLSSTPTWVPVSAGAVPSVSTGTYFQISNRFLVTNATQNPTLNDFTQNWNEGQAADKAYATYFKDAIWWAVASGTSATTNNKILRYDLINQAWLLYDIPINGFYTRGTSLYFGGALTGNIFKFGDTDNDNGSPINGFWKSKDFFGENPFTDSDLPTLSLFFGSVANSSMTVVYTINGSSSTSYIVPLYRPVSFGISNRAMPQGTGGNTLNIKFGNNAADQPFEMFAVQYGSQEKPWRPGNQ